MNNAYIPSDLASKLRRDQKYINAAYPSNSRAHHHATQRLVHQDKPQPQDAHLPAELNEIDCGDLK